MDTITENETIARAWVGCLGCYNSGLLNGSWVNGNEAADISKALKVKIGDPALYGTNCEICVKCGSDEFWVFDYEGYEGLISGECSPREAQDKAELLESVSDNEREAFAAYIALGYEADIEAFREAYIGEFSTNTALGEYFIDELGSLEIPESVKRYFDYEAYGQDLSYDFSNHSGFYFWNN